MRRALRGFDDSAEVSVRESANLGVEAEVAFKMRTKPVGPGVTAATALLAVESAVPALELLDFVFSGKPRAVDYIASSIVAQGIALGTPVAPLDGLNLATEPIE